MCQIDRPVAREMQRDALARVALQKGRDGHRCFGCPAAPGAPKMPAIMAAGREVKDHRASHDAIRRQQ
jgi:hypothetical protein